MQELYIGLMSGTSLDGVDGVVVDFSKGCEVLAHHSIGFPDPLRAELLELNSAGENELHRSHLCANALALLYAQVCHALLEQTGLTPQDISAVGAHGQTVRHRPGAFDGVGYSVQLNNPALLAERTGIKVCADFRSRDIAAGGQGAPLVPAFHKGLFQERDSSVCVLNLGGISNLSVLPPLSSNDDTITGFDCGPANCLMDAWCLLHTGQAFDDSGAWAAQGTVIKPLLECFLDTEYFKLRAPKSTGRDLFNMEWLEHKLKACKALNKGLAEFRAEDIQATLAMLCVQACVDSIHQYASAPKRLIVCGGGALNDHVMKLFSKALPTLCVESSQNHGLPPLQVEAAAFAWLAMRCVKGQTASLKSVTGAHGARILGSIYQA